MYSDFGLVAWNWQKLEIDSSSRHITSREDKDEFLALRNSNPMLHPSLGSGPFRCKEVPAVVAKALGRHEVEERCDAGVRGRASFVAASGLEIGADLIRISR